jgi:tetratricopeptide (TPR) repeat protein
VNFRIVAALLTMSLASCEKAAPTSSKSAPSESPKDHSLSTAQLAHAKTLLGTGSPSKALAYLTASSLADPTPDKQRLIAEILSSQELSIPTTRFTHPYPVTHFTYDETALYAALGDSFSTVVRWSLSEPEAPPLILFPTHSEEITHLSLSPNGAYLIVHRGGTNLLCNAKTLKPIRALKPFPENLDAADLQPFTDNSLLTASPSLSGNTLTWHIHDTATGEEISATAMQALPAPRNAFFSGNNLILHLEDQDEVTISPIGEITRTHRLDTRPRAIPIHPTPEIYFSSEGNTITLHCIVPSSPEDTDLLDAISGWKLNRDTQELEEIPIPKRLEQLHLHYPEIPPTLSIFSADTPVKKRLAAAFPKSFPEISAPARANAEIVRSSFATGDEKIISSLIASLPPSGLATSTALFLAYRSGNQDWIKAITSKAENLPPALLKIGAANTPIPDLTDLRRQQDWIGFELPDFTPIFQSLTEEKSKTLGRLTLPADPADEQLTEFIAALQSNEALIQIGATGIADSAIRAAHLLATDASRATTAIALTTFAERYGASRSSSLRIRAVAHTTLGDFESAHSAWIDLITNQPEDQHLASDYTEAAYTAFETSAPDQAIAILETGVFRFPDDVAFSIRASWIALLTDHPGEASRYLKNATRIGLPANEVENTTALLAITHTQLGDPETAHGYLEQLIAINPAWNEPETIEKLPWPEPLKASLRQLTWQP